VGANLTACDDCGAYDLDFIENLQTTLSQKMAAEISKKRLSEANDLGLCFNHTTYWELYMWNSILEQIKYCNSCFAGYDIETIVSKIKNTLSE